MDLAFWRDLAVFLVALLFIIFVIVVTIFLFVLGKAIRKAEHDLDLKLKQWNQTAQSVQDFAKKKAAPVARPFATLIALKEGGKIFLRTFLRPPT